MSPELDLSWNRAGLGTRRAPFSTPFSIINKFLKIHKLKRLKNNCDILRVVLVKN